ncbi:helix-turn-helix domain-containing protein [Thauera sp. ZXT1-4]|uniref:helix-turn-helix domain-containing protein n=1 Tax=Thauera sp. ZXT1-4 TaxID=3460294 RepID=UPI0040408B24
MQDQSLHKPATMVSSPGTVLRGAREARGESVGEVAFALKLSPRQIDAMENDDFAALPGMAFVRGFMRNYARYLGIDAAPLLEAVQRLVDVDTPDLSPIRNAEGQIPMGDARRSGGFPFGVVVVLLAVALAVGWYFDWFRTEPVTAVLEPAPDFVPAPVQPLDMPLAEPALPPAAAEDDSAAQQAAAVTPDAGGAADQVDGKDSAAEASAPAPAPAPAPAVAPAAEATAPAGVENETNAADAAGTEAPEPAAALVDGAEATAGTLGFRFAADSWIEVRDGKGTILHSGVNRAGSARTVQGTPPFALVVGNSASVTLEHDGKPVDLAAHTRGSVARLTLP